MNHNWLDIQHRGFSAYLEETEGIAACEKLMRAILRTNGEGEHVDTALYDCEVKYDWIERIEEALPFLENAVRENRQFILRHGETVPVENAKRVSKTSVEHLSKHSELITTFSRAGEDLIPKKSYVTENIGTYAVYENRFLYMLLCYLRDFISFRYTKVTELSASFSSNICLNKEISDGTRKIHYALTYAEISQGVDGPCDSKTDEAIFRIRKILQAVEMLLKTDLMNEVSAEPLLKPPITKTNVLLHNPNFKVALKLYDFLTTYTDDGFVKIERYRNSGDFSDKMRADFAALIAVTSYLAYRCGGLYEELEERFLAEKSRRQQEAEKAKKDELSALKRKLGENDAAAFAYILALEQRNIELENIVDNLSQAQTVCLETQNKLDSVMERIKLLQAENSSLEAKLQEKDGQISLLSQMNAQALNDAHQRLQQAQMQMQEAERRFDSELHLQKQNFLQEYHALAEKYRLSNARYHALSGQQGLQMTDEAFYTKESFAQLEAEYDAFRRFFQKQWKIARKQIRKEQLGRNEKK